MAEAESCEIRYSGRRSEQLEIFVAENIDKFFNLGSHAHQLHLTFQNVHELRQLIQFVLAQETADSRDARVPMRSQQTALPAIRAHAPEFEEAKLPQAFSNAPLRIQNRAAILELDRQCNHRKQRSQ